MWTAITLTFFLVLLVLNIIALYTIEFITEDNKDGVSWEYFKRVFPHMPRHIWNTLWIRKNEFHKSLDLDAKLLGVLNREGRHRYIMDLERRRGVAHYNSMDE